MGIIQNVSSKFVFRVLELTHTPIHTHTHKMHYFFYCLLFFSFHVNHKADPSASISSEADIPPQ